MRMTVSGDHGATGFPPPPARGRVWEDAARTQRDGETGFPPARGRVWEGDALPRKYFHPIGVRESRMDG